MRTTRTVQEACHWATREETRNRRFSSVLDALAREPGHPALLELRGDLFNRQERGESALQSWREAFEHSANDRLREKMLKAERELQAGRDYALATSSHFNLRYDGEVDLKLADAVTDKVLQLRALEKWDGVLPKVTGDVVPFIQIDTSSKK